MTEALVLGGIGNLIAWGTPPSQVFTAYSGPRKARAQPATSSIWLSAEEVAQRLLTGECREAGVTVPARFAPQALASALSSVQRWTREGRIFCIQNRYAQFQFDSQGRPHPLIESALAILGRADALRVGRWFAGPNQHLGGKCPQDLVASAPEAVQYALERVQ